MECEWDGKDGGLRHAERLLLWLACRQQISNESFYAQIQTQGAGRKAAQEEHDHPDVPQGTLAVPEFEVETMQTVVEPALHAAVAVHLRQHFAGAWIDIDPTLHGVAELHAQHRQR